MHVVKRIFRYLKGQPTLSLWYPKDLPLELIAYSDSDYAGASLDRKSTTGGCQVLGSRLLSWQCKKQTIVANSTTEAEYIAFSNCYGQVLWLQNQLFNYGYNFMQTNIHVDNKSAICVVKNLVYHSKTKHIEIRHHFIRDSYEKRLIEMVKIHTDYNVVDLLTKAYDYLINDGYADLVQHVGDYFNTTGVFFLGLINTTNGHQFTMSNRQERIGYSRANDNCNFWTSAKVKEVNDEVQIQALVDGKRVNIKEYSIRCILRLDDAKGTSCLTNAEIFKGLARMGAKTTSWNEFSGTMASAIICLATNQKFNFSRYILLSLVKNIEAGVPFFMFPRFVQLIINHQLGDMTHHKAIFDTPSLSKKVFANMKRVGTGFFREFTPLFANMLVLGLEEVDILQADAQPIPILTEPSTSKPQKKHILKRKHTQELEVPPTKSQAEHNLPLPSPSYDPLPSGEDSLKLKELMDLRESLYVNGSF
nr:putative ribonuclease H-like domain-containing protein [Tanacetum cinerariifolium]